MNKLNDQINLHFWKVFFGDFIIVNYARNKIKYIYKQKYTQVRSVDDVIFEQFIATFCTFWFCACLNMGFIINILYFSNYFK